jgi:AcrR family transcriptional regulator
MSTTSRERATREDALRLAKRTYLKGERVDINQLAQGLGVNRVTLQRWVGTRDALLLEVVWPLSEATLRGAWAEIVDTPGPRVPRLMATYLRVQLAHPGARRFLVEENERAMKLFTNSSYGHQPRLIAEVRSYLEQDVREGRTVSPLSLDELAYATVRIAESYTYLPSITGEDPDPEGSLRVLEVFLGGAR